MDKNLSELPFHVKHLESNNWPLDEDSKKFMDDDSIAKYQEACQLAEDDVVFKGIHITWDSCDCGQGYGCSHPDWPFEGRFNDDPEVEFEFEDDSIRLSKNGKHITVGPTGKMTMQDFKTACEMIGIILIPGEKWIK
jgi:hypothetical protein